MGGDDILHICDIYIYDIFKALSWKDTEDQLCSREFLYRLSQLSLNSKWARALLYQK